MELIKASLPPDHEIVWIACTHFGNSHQHLEGIQETVAYVARGTNRRAAIVGDIAEAISPQDKRHEQETHKETITSQYNRAVDTFRPIRRKILFANAGNHDTKVRTHGDMVKDIFCKYLEIPYGTVSCKLIVSDKTGKLQYKVFATHPHSGSINSSHPDPIMREAAEKVQLKRRLCRERMGDCILNVAAHYHKAIVVKPYQGGLYLIDDGEALKQRYKAEADPRAEYIDEDLRWYGSIPGWIRKHMLHVDSYVEKNGLDPLPLGAIRTVTQGGKIVEMKEMLV